MNDQMPFMWDVTEFEESSPTTSNSPSPTSSATGRQVIGLCFYCHEPETAIQPGGLEPMHLDGTAYEGCPQAMRSTASARPPGTPELLLPEAVFIEAQAFNQRHRGVLEDPRNDPTLRESWLYFPAADGNKKRMIYKPFIGLK